MKNLFLKAQSRTACFLLAFCFLLPALCSTAQVVKPDHVVSPRGPNTKVSYDMKFAGGMFIPHYSLSSPPSMQDTLGKMVLNTDDNHIHIKGTDMIDHKLAYITDATSGSSDTIYFKKFVKVIGHDTVELFTDTTATANNNFLLMLNQDGYLVKLNANYSQSTQTIIFNGIKINANGGLQTNAPIVSGAGTFLKQNTSTGLVEKDTVTYLRLADSDKYVKIKSGVITGPQNLTLNDGVISTLTVNNTHSSNAPALTVNGQSVFNGQAIFQDDIFTPVLKIPLLAGTPNFYYIEQGLDSSLSMSRAGKAGINMRDTVMRTDNGSRFLTTHDIPGTYAVSVFGRTGAVVATSGDYNTSQVTENTNLYFTNARVLTAPLTGFVSGAGTASSSDNVLQAFQKINGNEVVDAANIATNTSNIATNTANISTNTTAIATKVTGTLTAANKTTTVVSTGDSMSADTWEAQLQTLLGTNYSVLSFGRPGDQTNGMLARQNGGISSIGASYQIVLGGINNIPAGVTALQTEADLQAIYTSAHNAGSKVIALTILPFGASSIWTSGRQAVADSVNTWILGTATNLDYKIDMRPVLWDPSNHLNLNPTYASGDFLHPNSTGYNLIGTTIYADVPFAVSTATPILYVSKNSVIDQNLQSDQSVYWKKLNTFILKVTSSRDPSYPMPQVPAYLLQYFGGTKGAMAYDTTNNMIRTFDGSHYRMVVSMDSIGNVYAPSNSITLPALTQVAGQLTVTNTTTQQYLNYDVSHGATFSVNSGGSLTINTTGGVIGSSGGFLGLDFLSASTGLINSTTGSNASYATPTTGAVISRDQPDTNPALIVNLKNASSTGKIAKWQFAGTDKGTLDNDGTLTLVKYGTGIAHFNSLGVVSSSLIANADMVNNTISGIALGSTLANLTATDATLTFSGTYTGATARTIGLNLGNANTWTAEQTIQLTTEQFSINYDGTHKTTFTEASTGNLTIAPSSSVLNISGTIIATGSIQGGGTTSNIYIPSTTNSIRSNVAAYQIGGGSFNNFRVGFGGGTSTTLTAGDDYYNVAIGKSPITVPSGTPPPILAQLAIGDMGLITNASSVAVGEKTLLYIEAPAAVTNSSGSKLYSIHAAGSIKTDATIQLNGYTVSTLPTGIAGATAYVTDASAPTFGATLVGGGAVVSKAFYNGTNWIAQ